MTEPRGDWRDIFRAFRMSLDLRKLWLAFCGLLLSLLLLAVTVGSIGCVEDALNIRFTVEDELGRDGAPTGHLAVDRRIFTEVHWPGVKHVLETEVWDAVLGANPVAAAQRTVEFARALVWSAWTDVRRHVVIERNGCANVALLLARSTSLLEVVALAISNGILLLLVWSYYAGAIMRIAAVEYAFGERIEMASASAYTWRKHGALFGAPFGLLVAICVLGLGIALVGAIAWNILVVATAAAGLLLAGVAGGFVQDRMHSGKAGMAAGVAVLACALAGCGLLAAAGARIPYLGEILAGLLSPVAMLGGIAMALLGAWLCLGTRLMFATVASEDTDTFQACSRSISILCKQPWRFAAYSAVTAAYGTVCLSFVYLVRRAGEALALAFLSPGVGGRAESAYGMAVRATSDGDAGSTVLTAFLRASHYLLDLSFLSLAVVFALSARTIAYFLLRMHSDGRPVAEVHLEPRDGTLLIASPYEPDDEETEEEMAQDD